MNDDTRTPTEILYEAGFEELADELAAPEEVLRNLGEISADLDSIKLVCVRHEAIQRLKGLKFNSPSKMVDSALPTVKASRNGTGESQGRAVIFEGLEPWNEPVDGKALLEELQELVTRFLVTCNGAPLAIALFVLFTYVYQLFDVCAILAFISAVKRCGKTRAMGLLSCLVQRPLPASNVTPATLFRSVEKYEPTLLIDEADSFMKQNEELRGILNSGHQRAMAYILRSVGDDHEPRQFITFAPKIIAQIKQLPATLEDRSIIIPMSRKKPAKEWPVSERQSSWKNAATSGGSAFDGPAITVTP